MKILMVTPMPPQARAPGAIPVVLYAELVGLMQRNDVSLVTVAGLEPGEIEATQQLEAMGIRLHVVRPNQPARLQKWKRRWRLTSTWLAGKYPWRTVWFWDPDLQRRVDDVLAHDSCDLVIVEDNAMGIYAYGTHVPSLFTEHEVRRPRRVDWAALRYKDPVRWVFGELDWARWPSYQTDTWQKFSRIQTFTQRDAQAICTLRPDLASRVRVNPFGILLPPDIDPAGQDNKTILFVGNFTHPPNADAAVWLGREIMPLLRQRSPGVSLMLVGIYPPAEVLSLAADDIVVTGPVEDLEPIWTQAAVVVAPVRIGGGMRMKVLNAMAMGKAVVTTNRGADGFAWDGVEPPLLIADDGSEFANVIAGLLADRARRIELGLQSRKFVESHFSAQAYARRIEDIYAEMKAGL